MFICTSPNVLHAIPLFIWVTVNACCNKNRPKGLCLWTWPSWPLLHSWGLEGARPCSTYHVSKRSHSLSRLLRYKWNTYNNVCYFRLLIAKKQCYSPLMSWRHPVMGFIWTLAKRLTICTSFCNLHTDIEFPAHSTLHFFSFLFCGVCIERLSELEWCYWTEH